MSSKTFHVGDVLSAMTGRLVSPDGVDGMYRILDHLASESLMTHQLPRVSREAEPILRERYPTLAAIEIPEWTFTKESMEDRKAVVMEWLRGVADAVGEWWEVQPLDAADHTVMDPIAELKMIRPGLPIIGVTLDES